MFRQTYQSFPELVENCPFVGEDNCRVIGQGLYDTYDVNCYGTGQNRYVLEFVDKEKEDRERTYIFRTCDDFILNWRIRSHPEHGSGVPDEENDFDFEAFGYLSDHLHGLYLYNRDCDDPTLFDLGDQKLILKQISVELSNQSLKPLTGISNCYVYCERIMEPRQRIISSIHDSREIDKSQFVKSRLRQVVQTQDSKPFLFVSENGEIYQLKLLKELEREDESGLIFRIKGLFEISIYHAHEKSKFQTVKLEIEAELMHCEFLNDPDTGEVINDPDSDDACNLEFTLQLPEKKYDLDGFISLLN